VLNPSILKTERPPVTCARSNGYCCRSNAPDRAAATSRRSGFVLWHETVMAAQSQRVCCLVQSGRQLLEMSISHFDPKQTSFAPPHYSPFS
jgi:hypothetical protein